jgi:hypothetical protein
MKSRLLPPVALAYVLGIFTFADRSWAQSRQSAVAERLFEEARVLLSKGQNDEACARFEESEKVEPAVGTLLNLAECADRKGKTATAWQRYRQAATLAARRGDADREALALRKKDVVEQRLSRVVLRPPATPLPASATVSRDGDVVPATELGGAVAVDPGEHRVTLEAPGFRPWSQSITVGSGPVTVEVELPTLEPQPDRAPAPPPRAGEQVAATEPPPRAAAPPNTSSLGPPTGTWIAAGVGGIALATGGIFALRARSAWSDVDARCPGGRCFDQSTIDSLSPRHDEAQRDATVATVALAVGGAALAVAVVLYLMRPSSRANVALYRSP